MSQLLASSAPSSVPFCLSLLASLTYFLLGFFCGSLFPSVFFPLLFRGSFLSSLLRSSRWPVFPPWHSPLAYCYRHSIDHSFLVSPSTDLMTYFSTLFFCRFLLLPTGRLSHGSFTLFLLQLIRLDPVSSYPPPFPSMLPFLFPCFPFSPTSRNNREGE